MKKPVAHIVFENYRDEFVITADVPVDVLVIDYTWREMIGRNVHHATINRKRIEKEFGKRCPACKHSIALCICQRMGE